MNAALTLNIDGTLRAAHITDSQNDNFVSPFSSLHFTHISTLYSIILYSALRVIDFYFVAAAAAAAAFRLLLYSTDSTRLDSIQRAYSAFSCI